MAHDELGHNGTHSTYILLKRLYYWKGLKTKCLKNTLKCVTNAREEIDR